MHLTIASKLSLISAVFIAITAASIITAFYIGGSQQLLDASLRQYDTLVQLEGQHLSDALEDKINDLHLISHLKSVTSLAERLTRTSEMGQFDELRERVEEDFLNLMQQHDSNYRQLRFIGLDGHEKVRVDQANDTLTAAPPLRTAGQIGQRVRRRHPEPATGRHLLLRD